MIKALILNFIKRLPAEFVVPYIFIFHLVYPGLNIFEIIFFF